MAELRQRTLRAAVVGLGNMGRNHLRILRELPQTELVAICDASRTALTRYSDDSNLRLYDDYRRLLAEEDLNMITVAVPNRLHYDVTLAAIERGVHVLVEKPVAATVAEGLAMKQCAEEAGVKLAVGHVERFNPAVIEMKRQLQRGTLGRVWQIHATRINPFPQRVRDVGVVHDLAPHDIDVMRYLLESDVERLSAEIRRGINTPHEDMVAGLLRFTDGTIGVININWLSPIKMRHLAVLGEKGMLSMDYVTQEITFYEDGHADPARTAALRIPVDKGEPLKLELAAFASAILNDTEPAVSAADAIIALYLADCLVEAATGGHTLRPLSSLEEMMATFGGRE